MAILTKSNYIRGQRLALHRANQFLPNKSS